jgi:hypothetical protein
MPDLDDFTHAYVVCALWSSTDNSDETGGQPLDLNYDIEDIAPDSLTQIIEDCRDFRDSLPRDEQGRTWVDLAAEMRPKFYDECQAGHDFWLTRNGHGAGFWDRGLGELGDKLTAHAKSFSGRDLYIGDDHLIHQGR